MMRILFVISLFWSCMGLAMPQTLSSTTTAPTSNKKWDFATSYALSNDTLELERPRQYTHSFSGIVEYRFDENFSLATEIALRMLSIGASFREEDGRYLQGSYGLDIGGSYRKKVLSNNLLRLGARLIIPADDPSRYEGYKAIAAAFLELMSPFFSEVYWLGNSFKYTYILNTYDFSTSREYNPRDAWTYQLSNSFKFAENWAVGFSFGVKWTRHLDGFTKYNYNNTQFISYGKNDWSTTLSHINGGFTDEGKIDLWYIDKFRNLVSWSVSYAF